MTQKGHSPTCESQRFQHDRRWDVTNSRVTQLQRHKTNRFTLSIIAAVLILVGCSGGAPETFSGQDAALPMDPTIDGFAFPNFGEKDTNEFLGAADLAIMFGPTVCTDEITDPCRPIAEAAAWAMMVNSARASGHCEGFAVQSALRFDEQAEPKTIFLPKDANVTRALIRGFATQFLPEVQKETTKWAKKTLKEKVDALIESFSAATPDTDSKSLPEPYGQAQFTAGLYTEVGGHALLPYAVTFVDETTARISVLDSNWPGRERYITVDLAANEWRFSYSGEDPEKRPS